MGMDSTETSMDSRRPDLKMGTNFRGQIRKGLPENYIF